MPTLEVKSESIEQLKGRFDAALEDVYDRNSDPRPGEQRKHVFDFENGLRLIISFDKLHDGWSLHISASCDKDSPLFSKVMEEEGEENGIPSYRWHINAFTESAVSGFDSISSQPCSLKIVSITKAVVHWAGPTHEEWVSALC